MDSWIPISKELPGKAEYLPEETVSGVKLSAVYLLNKPVIATNGKTVQILKSGMFVCMSGEVISLILTDITHWQHIPDLPV